MGDSIGKYENEINFKALFENAPGLYLVLSPDLTILAVSESYASATMTKRENILGKPLFEIFPDNPDDPAADGVTNLHASLESVLKYKVPHTMAVQKYDIRKPNGKFELRYWSPINKPVLNGKQEVEYIIHRVEDVTEIVRMKKKQGKKEKMNYVLHRRLEQLEFEIFKRSKEIQNVNTELEHKLEQLKEAEEEIKKLNAELEQKVIERTRHLKEANKAIQRNLQSLSFQEKQLEDFCNIISHNLRAPLVNISMLVDSISNAGEESERKILTEKLSHTTNHLNEVFNQLVQSLQIIEDTEIKSEQLIVEEYIKKTLGNFQRQIIKTKAIVEVRVSHAPTLLFPPKYLSSILYHLISNALKYHSPERSPVITIETRKDDEGTILSIADNGLGIDLKKHKHHLFKMRKVFHPHPDAKGVGLFITCSQVEAMGGRIWVDSIPGKGSTFFIEFKN